MGQVDWLPFALPLWRLVRTVHTYTWPPEAKGEPSIVEMQGH